MPRRQLASLFGCIGGILTLLSAVLPLLDELNRSPVSRANVSQIVGTVILPSVVLLGLGAIGVIGGILALSRPHPAAALLFSAGFGGIATLQFALTVLGFPILLAAFVVLLAAGVAALQSHAAYDNDDARSVVWLASAGATLAFLGSLILLASGYLLYGLALLVAAVLTSLAIWLCSRQPLATALLLLAAGLLAVLQTFLFLLIPVAGILLIIAGGQAFFLPRPVGVEV